MSAPSTLDQFLDLAGKSGLLDPQGLRTYLQRLRGGGGAPAAPRALADALVRDGLLTRFQVEQLLLGKWRNFVLSGKYKVLGPLGAGGMGAVFLCEHKVMRRRVAVKVLPASRADDPAHVERFHRESRAVARLRHPNIVTAHDVDRDANVHFLVLEYVDGNTFHRIVKARGPMAPLRAAHYVRQAALGLQHAHEAGLVHRDVKPSNLLLDRTGTVKVLDLGLARFFHDEPDDLSRRHADSPVGTMDYMAPEQALDSHAVDIRADIYGLGATFYYLLAGHGPFQEGTTAQKLLWHQVRPPRPVREVRPEVPEGVAAVIERMMAKAPEDRYQTPAEVAEALAPWTQMPIPPPPPEEMPPPALAGRGAGPAEEAPGLPVSLYPPAPTPTPASTKEGAADFPSAAQPSATPTAVMATKSATTRPAPPGAARAVSRPPSAGKARRRWAGAALVALVVLAGAAGVAAYKMRGADGTPGPGGPPAPGPVAAPRLRLLVPAYFYPAGEGLAEWFRLIESAGPAGTVVIANTSSGPGDKVDPNYAKVLERARQKKVVVLGYVSTKYGKRPLAEVKDDVDRWARFYPGTQGIFFDEQASDADQVLYYAALYEYVRKDRGLALVVSNPGAVCTEEYLARPTADVACLFETTKELNAYRHPAWASRYPPNRFAALACKVEGVERMKQALNDAVAKKIGYCYVTDGRGDNPWGRLPRYWDDEVAAVRQLNAANAP
ncbi:MAG TPA: spherulation-specific family 4 protein [Gemmataceae bacterium]|nr:spherulation-specific family 4 protein [Gemmataceae bacterium]